MSPEMSRPWLKRFGWAVAAVVAIAYVAIFLALGAWILCFLPFDVPGVRC
jgi:hypothetical protein